MVIDNHDTSGILHDLNACAFGAFVCSSVFLFSVSGAKVAS